MKDSKDILSSILKTTQMGQVGIRSVMKVAVRTEMKEALQSQLSEYDAIEREAFSIAASRGWTPDTLDPAVKGMAAAMTKMKLQGRDSDSKIAAMMINGNTRGLIKSLKNMHRFTGNDARVATLAQKLLDCERANAAQMEGFL